MINKTHKKRSILFINKDFPPENSVAGRHAKELADYCLRRGWMVSALFLSDNAKDIRQAQKKNKNKNDLKLIPVQYNAEENKDKKFAGLWSLYKKGTTLKKYDVVISMTEPPLLANVANMIAKMKGAKHIHWVFDLYPDLFPILDPDNVPGFQKFLKRLSRKAMKKSDHIVATGHCMEKHLKDTGIDPWSISTIPNWASVSLFETAVRQGRSERTSQQQTQARPKKQAEPKFRVMYAGNLGNAHDVEPLLHAMQRLSKSNPEIEFVFVGNSTGHKFLRQKHSRYGLKNSRFLKPQPDSKFKALLELADVHIVSMAQDALGLFVPSKFYSIIAAKRPVIFAGPHQCEIAKVIKDYKCGVVTDPTDKKAFIDAILAFRNDPDLWFQSHEGAINAREILNPAKSLVQWEEVLDRVTKS